MTEITRLLSDSAVSHLSGHPTHGDGAVEVEIIVRDTSGSQPDTFLSGIADALTGMLEQEDDGPVDRTAATRPIESQEAAVAALSRGGVDVVHGRAGSSSVIERTARRFADLVRDSLPLVDVAIRLGVTESRLRQRIGDRSLFAVRGHRGEWRVPEWELEDDHVITGLSSVVRALSPDAHALTIAGFLTSPNPDLQIGAVPVSPIDWLRTGGDPRVAAGLAADMLSAA